MDNKLFLLSSVFLLSSSFSHAEVKDNKIKNVLFIASDDLKPLLSCYGDKTAITPNIDKIASKGVVFHSAYCQQAISSATRASLLTGWCPDKTGVRDLKTYIRDVNPDVVTLPQIFRENGWQVTGVGKIFDSRTVDKNADKLSWSKYLPTDKLRDEITKGKYYGWYVGEETVKEGQKLEEKARAKGAKGYAATAESLKSLKPSTECADVPDEFYVDGVATKLAVDYINDYSSDKPLFLAVGFQKPHLPFCAPKKYWDMYNRNEIPLAQYKKKAIDTPDYAYHNSPELMSYTDIKPVAKFSKEYNTILPESKERELIHGYYACVSFMDAQIGRLLDALEKKGMAENTAIVFWGDHGWHLGDHGMWNKHSNFEQATHVPFIIYVPGVNPQVVTSPVEFLDIYPTLCDLMGIDSKQQLHGASLMPIIEGKTSSVKKYAVSQWPKTGKMGYTLRTERYRYTVWVEHTDKINRDKVFAEELYDYEKDPLETKSLINDSSYKEIYKMMKGYWDEYKNSVRCKISF